MEFKRRCRNRGQNSVLKVPTDLPQRHSRPQDCLEAGYSQGQRETEASSNCRNQEMLSYPHKAAYTVVEQASNSCMYFGSAVSVEVQS